MLPPGASWTASGTAKKIEADGSLTDLGPDGDLDVSIDPPDTPPTDPTEAWEWTIVVVATSAQCAGWPVGANLLVGIRFEDNSVPPIVPPVEKYVVEVER